MTDGKKNLSAFAAWGLSFGFAVGWGAFVMPGAAFLPDAGPLGTLIGIVAGAVAMAVIGWNYHRMSARFPGPAGACAYAHHALGADYGYLTAWSLSLAYMAILWANATALVLLVRYLFGDVLQFGWHDTLAGFDIYLGEVLLSVAVMVVAGCVCLWGRRLAGRVQAALAAFMLAGVSVCFFAAASRHSGGLASMAPAFAASGEKPLAQVLKILAMMPWAFVGFEAVSHSSGDFRFPAKRLWRILVAAIVASVAMYAMLALMPVLAHPAGYETWTDYIKGSRGLAGLDSMPTFASARTSLGQGGVALLGTTMFAAIFTGIVGATVAMSRLLYSLSTSGILPGMGWFGRLDGRGSPRNAILFVVGVSFAIPFFGRTVIGWPVEVSSIGAAVAYCCTSLASWRCARKDGDMLTMATGIAGAAMSVAFCLLLLVPNYISGSALSAESYLVLALWCIIGFALYRSVFKHDSLQRFGKSPVVWTGIVILIFFSSLMWVRLSAQNATGRTVKAIVDHSARHCELVHGMKNARALHDEEGFVSGMMEVLNDDQLRYDIVQMVLLSFSLVIMFNLYAIQWRREEQLEVAHAKAEARDRAKSAFLSSVSHDIRTPMNAITGYVELAKRAGGDIGKVREYVAKMESSSNRLLALINDVLEMSRIESGKVDLEPVPLDLAEELSGIAAVFAAQMAEKRIGFATDASLVRHPRVMCDRGRLNRILLNLVGNAWKFTPAGGRITVTLAETGDDDGSGKYELRVKDTGIGMSREFVSHVFDPFERERTAAVGDIEGTGLGMPITKGIVDLMGGTIDVESEQGRGTEFIVRLTLPFAPDGEGAAGAGDGPASAASGARAGSGRTAARRDFSSKRILLVEDNAVNREIAQTLLSQSGFAVDTAENGKVAVEKFSRGGPGHYDAILMDVHMPVLDGYAATRTIRAMELPGGPRVPVVALSANAFETDVKDALAAGMDAHVAKPIRLPALLNTLGNLIFRTEGGSAADAGEPRSIAAANGANAGGPQLVAAANGAKDICRELAKMGCDIETVLRDTYVGNRPFYLKMLARLPESDAPARIRAALDAADPAALFSASHNLKGLYASLGLTPLHALCGEIVEIARAGSLDGAAERFARLEKMHGDVLDLLGK